MTIASIPLRTVAPAVEPSNLAGTPSVPGAFQTVFDNAVHQVGHLQGEAAASVKQFLNGEGGELHEVALATQRAELAFEMFQQVRNKMVQAYQEVMRMQL